MNRETFEKKHEHGWRQLEALLKPSLAGRPRQVVAEFPALYRRACHHLALTRYRHYGADLEQRLNRLMLGGHQRLYSNRTIDFSAVMRFAGAGFPALVRSEGRLVALAAALFALPAVALFLAVVVDPDLAMTVLDPTALAELSGSYGPGGSLAAGRPVDSDLLMFGFYIYNNISIAFRTFAGGMLLGVGSIFFLTYNGVVLGAVSGYIQHSGYGAAFYPFVIGHGSFELTAIVLSGAAGLRLGITLVAPGRSSRRQALIRASRRIVPMIYGVGGMLVIAAFLEAFWSSSSLPGEVKVAVGVALWLFVLLYFTLFGRGHGP